jgi:ribosomal protein S1
MDNILTGKIIFIQHDKKYATIEYTQKDKTKNINGNIDEKYQQSLKEKKIIKSIHKFSIGDTVSFIIRKSDKANKMIADNIQFLYNNALDVLINKALVENKFLGYLKIVDDKYFIKEIDSYILFPLPISPWQITPTENDLNESIYFKLENLDKKDKITAAFFNPKFIPAYYKALQWFNTKTIIAAKVHNLTPHGIYVNIFDETLQAKIPLQKGEEVSTIKVGDNISVLITYLSPTKIVVERG